jgi:hypothetical protein
MMCVRLSPYKLKHVQQPLHGERKVNVSEVNQHV